MIFLVDCGRQWCERTALRSICQPTAFPGGLAGDAVIAFCARPIALTTVSLDLGLVQAELGDDLRRVGDGARRSSPSRRADSRR